MFAIESTVRVTPVRLHVAMMCGGLMLGVLGSTVAQSAESEAAADSDAIAEVVVTARKRNESQQNVPLSVAAFDSSTLESRGVTTVADMQNLVPGLHYQERGNLQTELTIRGVGGDARNPGIDSGVGMYVDGAYVPRTSGYNSDVTDIAQIEVLRGPQGTLFGKNTIGGVINITTRKPSEEVERSVFASIGNYGAIRTQAVLSGPLSDHVSAEVTAATWNRDGYIENRVRGEKLNNEDRLGGRLQLRYRPSESLDVNLSLDKTRDRRLGVLNQMGSPAGAAAPYFTGNRFVIDADQRNLDSRDMWGATLGVDYEFSNGMTLTSITAFRDIDILVYSDVDQTPLDLFHSGPFTDDTTMYSQELRLVSADDSALRYVAGLYYYYQDVGSFREVYINGSRAIVIDAGATTRSLAAFANVDYDFTDRLTATVGVRFGEDKKDGTLQQTRANLNYDLTLDRRDENPSWTASLLFKATPRLSAYVAASRGFKAGGFNLDTPAVAGLRPADLNFLPEKVTNYEVGVKGRPYDWVRFSLAAFSMDYVDKQVAQLVSPPGSSFPVILVTNAGQAEIKGVELDTTFNVGPRLTLAANVSYVDATYKSFPDAARVGGVIVSYTGNRVERTPEWTLGASVDYRHPVSSGDFVLGANVARTGDVFLQPDNLQRNYEPGYTVADARLGYEAAEGAWGVFLWGKNIADKDFITFKRQFAGLDQVVFGTPRTYGIEIRARF